MGRKFEVNSYLNAATETRLILLSLSREARGNSLILEINVNSLKPGVIGASTILTEALCGFPQLLYENAGMISQIGSDGFLSSPLQLIMH
jgi:hypothetical protein